MRRLPALAVSVALVAAALTGCAAQSGPTACPRPAESAGTPLTEVSVGGDFGVKPDVSIPTPFVVDTVSYDDVITGDGLVLRAPDQLVQLDVALYDGETGAEVVAGSYDDGNIPIVSLAQWTSVIPDIPDLLDCASEGSRVVLALPAGGIEESVVSSFGLDPETPLVAVVDIAKVYLARATGSLVFNDARGLPTVVRAPDGRPGVVIPDGEPPAELVVQTLIKGAGPAVTSTDSVRVQYTGLTWAERSVFDTSWDSGPASFTLDGVVPGFAAALEGATVGSQVLVVIPPDQGYGDQEQDAIPAGSTLVFVIDVLGIDPPAATG